MDTVEEYCKAQKKKFDLIVYLSYTIFVIVLLIAFVYVINNNKYQEFPKGCSQGYTENMTPSGFVTSNDEYCYAKIYDGWDSECEFLWSKGCNSYRHISWEKEK